MSVYTTIYATEIEAEVVGGRLRLKFYDGPDYIHEIEVAGHADGDGVERIKAQAAKIVEALDDG